MPLGVVTGLLARSVILVNVLVLLALVLTAAGVYLRSRPRPIPFHSGDPTARTPYARPADHVVGYTPYGAATTSDQAFGYRPDNPHTNTMAVVAMILGLTVFPLAIPFGHVARTQIRQTGERGDGLAVTGLIMGYAFSAIAVIAFALKLYLFFAVHAAVGPR